MDLHRLLEAATVRVWRNGAAAGSGFLVTPEQVLTCAHVVLATDVSAIEVEVFGDRSTTPVVVPVRSSVVLPLSASPNGLHPLPDVALLTVDRSPLTDFCVRLSEHIPEIRAELYTFGFPAGLAGDSRTLSHEGRAFLDGSPATPLIGIGANAFPGGFSGAPVLDERRADVCAMIKARRGQDEGQGGWAVPLKVLLEGIGRDDLLEENRHYHRTHPAWDGAAGVALALIGAGPASPLAFGRDVRVRNRRALQRVVDQVHDLVAPRIAGVLASPVDTSFDFRVADDDRARAREALAVVLVGGQERELAVLEAALLLRERLGHDVVVLPETADEFGRGRLSILTDALIAAGVDERSIPLDLDGLTNAWRQLASSRQMVIAIPNARTALDWDRVLVPELAGRGSVVLCTAFDSAVSAEICEEAVDLIDDDLEAESSLAAAGTSLVTTILRDGNVDGVLTQVGQGAWGLLRGLSSLPENPIREASVSWSLEPLPHEEMEALRAAGLLHWDREAIGVHPDVRALLRSVPTVNPGLHDPDRWTFRWATGTLQGAELSGPTPSRRGLLAAARIESDRRIALGESDDAALQLRTLARRLRDEGRAPTALSLMQFNRARASSALERGRTLIQIGHLYSRKRYLEEAATVLGEARSILPEQAVVERARVERHQAALLRKQSREEEAISVLRSARSMLRTIALTDAVQAELLSNLDEELVSCRRLDRIPDAMNLLEAGDGLMFVGDSRLLRRSTANHLRQRARTMLRLDDPVAAVTDLVRALELAPADSDAQFTARRDLATARLSLGELADAQHQSKAAAGLAINRAMPAGLADAQEVTGQVALAIGDLDRASSAFDAALYGYRAIHGTVGEARALVGLARVALRRGDIETAHDLTVAAEAAPAGADGLERPAVLRLQLALAMNGDLGEAATRCEEIETEANSRQLVVLSGACRRERARLAFHDGAPEDALELVADALDRFDGNGGYEEVIATLWLGALVEVSVGRLELAVTHLRAAQLRIGGVPGLV